MTPRVPGWLIQRTLVLGLAALLFFARLGERAFWSEEVRWAEIPREMRLNADYLQPTINGKSYYDKPLASYWLVLAASWLTGSLDETSVRLPCAVFALVGVALAMASARRLYDDDTAALTGIILATSFSYLFFARNASSDIESLTGILAALWLFLRNEATPAGGWNVLLWLIMAITSLTKGLLGFVLPVLILGIYASLTPADGESPPPRSWGRWPGTLWHRNRWLCNAWTLLALPLAGMVYLGPFLLSMVATGSTQGLEMVFRENIRRFYDPVNHRGPIYLYLVVIFELMAPWSLLLPAALAQAHAEPRQDRRHRFALAYFWGTLLFFTLSASRRSYYLLPILPAGACLVAHLLTRPAGVLTRSATLLLRAAFAVLTLAVVLSIGALLPAASLLPAPWDSLPDLPQPWFFVLAWSASVVALAFVWRGWQPERIARAWVVIACAFMMYLYLFLLPGAERYRTQKPFAQAVKEHLGPNVPEVALFHQREIVFYLDAPHPLAEYFTAEELREAMQAGKVRWLILRRRDWETLSLPARVVLEEPSHPWEGRDPSDGKLLLVEIQR